MAAITRRVEDALLLVWCSLRDDASREQIACAERVASFAYDAGLLTCDQIELWVRRFKECPGHDDEGGRSWCAYCGLAPSGREDTNG